MITIKIIEYKKVDKYVYIALLYDDDTIGCTTIIDGDRTRDEILKDAYIMTKNKDKRVPLEVEPSDQWIDWSPPESVATRLIVDSWRQMTGRVVDQYGDVMDIPIDWSIDGTGAEIIDGVLVEDVVDVDTSYFIVASTGDLEDRQQQYLHAPIPSEIETLQEKIEMTEMALADLMLMIAESEVL